MPWAQVIPILDPAMRELCTRKYPGHPKGCPNFGKRDTCPPRAPLLGEVLDLDSTIYVIWNVFDLGSHVLRMRANNPDWSWRQLVNCLYWQPKARQQLKGEVDRFLARERDRHFTIISCPEAYGVNVTETMALVGQQLQWPPKSRTYQVCFAGKALNVSTPREGLFAEGRG